MENINLEALKNDINMKKQFILNEIWSLSISGAFQRANVYAKNCNDDKIKNLCKNRLHELIIDIAEQYKAIVNEETHFENIIKVSQFTDDCLTNGQLNYGVSQKLLNLHLKYLWCLDAIPTPTHFPVDRIIQEKLKLNPIISWTKEMNEANYRTIIKQAKNQAEKENISIAELELKLFIRRNG
jgi:hypothetical protein